MDGFTPSAFDDVWPELVRELGRDRAYLCRLSGFIDEVYGDAATEPARSDLFKAFALTSFEGVRVVILGEDPYPKKGDAMGLAFSARHRIPGTLGRIFDELKSDPEVLGFVRPKVGDLTCWAHNGVLLLNRTLTRGTTSHVGQIWETFTDAAIELLAKRVAPVAFLLWGKDAWRTAERIRAPQHFVRLAYHPSPRAGRRFVGCRHFSQANEFLSQAGYNPIPWDCLT